MGKFEGKVALVTGSSKGIGKAVARKLLKKGATVVLNGRNSKTLEKARQELSGSGNEVLAIASDVSDSEAFSKTLQQIIDRYGKLDILVLNAGVSTYGDVESVTDEALQHVMNINTNGPFKCARLALPYIRKSKGSIVFISSLAGLHGLPNSSVYCMSKMALTAFAQSLRLELTGKKVHIGIVYVGFTVNEPDKTTIAPDGSIKKLQGRPGWVQQPVNKVAGRIVANIQWRRFRMVLSPIGKVMAFFARYFPRFWLFAMRGTIKSSRKLTAEG